MNVGEYMIEDENIENEDTSNNEVSQKENRDLTSIIKKKKRKYNYESFTMPYEYI